MTNLTGTKKGTVLVRVGNDRMAELLVTLEPYSGPKRLLVQRLAKFQGQLAGPDFGRTIETDLDEPSSAGGMRIAFIPIEDERNQHYVIAFFQLWDTTHDLDKWLRNVLRVIPGEEFRSGYELIQQLATPFIGLP